MGQRSLSQTGAGSDTSGSGSPAADSGGRRRRRPVWTPVQDELSTAGLTPTAFEPLAGDVSARRYARLRVASGECFVVCGYPVEMTDVAVRFLAATELLASVGVPVPRVERHSLDEPVWILMEDLGPQTLFERWQGGAGAADLDLYLAEAVELIRRIQLLPADRVEALGAPPLGRALLAAELELTWARFLEPRGLVADRNLAEHLRTVCDAVCERLGSAASVPCHRDFMARNLMPRAPKTAAGAGALVVIDHQDLRPGPPHYDLASLLNDSLTLSARERRRQLGVLEGDASQLALYHAATAQRTLKIVGTFAHFAAAGSDRYLRLIPPALRRFLDALDQLEEGRELAPRLRRAWASVLNR